MEECIRKRFVIKICLVTKYERSAFVFGLDAISPFLKAIYCREEEN